MSKLFYENESEIIDWLKSVEVKNFVLLQSSKYGYIVNVKGSVNLCQEFFDVIPVKFNIVSGNFNCSCNGLSTLFNSPEIVGGDFLCYENELINLEKSPSIVGKNFFCNNNKLISLRGCTNEVGGTFNCGYNNLTSLEFCPNKIGEDFFCYNNNLVSLEFIPKKLKRWFFCDKNSQLGSAQDITNFNDLLFFRDKIKFNKKLSRKLIEDSIDTKVIKL